MSKKTSFPQHMRNAQAALDVLAAECKECDPDSRDWIIEITAYNDGSDEPYMVQGTYENKEHRHLSVWRREVGLTLEDAATALLHTIAGTEEAPF